MAHTNLLTTRETAERLGVSARTVVRWAEAGKLPIALQLPGDTGALLFDAKVIDKRATKAAS